MGLYKLLMPKMGEGVIEATIITWLKNEGEKINEDDTILEVATDKVDTEIQSPVTGIVKKINYNKDDVVPVGEVLALIETEGDEGDETEVLEEFIAKDSNEKIEEKQDNTKIKITDNKANLNIEGLRLTPLVRNIAKKENISSAELASIKGTGANNKITKRDILKYIEDKKSGKLQAANQSYEVDSSKYSFSSEGDEIMEMDRMRKLIANHMVDSKRISPHVTSVVETDMTNIVNWRNKIKNIFLKKHNQKITYTPIFVEAVVKSLKDFPLVNSSVSGDQIILRKNINIGIATALPNGNLIVPVVKNADMYNLEGLTKIINDLVYRARENQLKPDEIQGGTFTITNLGTMGNILGTPIINQPQVAILAVGAITKKPSVLETEFGDVIAIRNKMYLSMSYDHRVVDGFLGGSFIKRVSDYLENFDINQTF
ncbi:MAG TPA: 2-oxo acid dehydrogenase subunit E2 [Bacteroidetes bacterium]|nr:2-oxo acid dehydrogenase subunit E2 [Bacteroidota bacterium]